jgi:ubiquinone/menaquinone biosynthesis C-methylase UbiE
MAEERHRFHHHDESERRKWQDPDSILARIGLKPGDTFVDIGCGDGFFTLPAARIVGEAGMVYGIDIDATGLDELRAKASAESLKNIFLEVGEAEDIVPCEGCADLVFYGIDLHDFHDQARVLANARSIVKPGGLLVDLDWKKEPTPMGPPLEIRFSRQLAGRMIEDAGFELTDVEDSGLYHYLIIARPAGGAASKAGGP